jgi:hypothetical protein
MKTIEVFWQDLSESLQTEIAGYLNMHVDDVPLETNWDAMALCSFDVDDNEDSNDHDFAWKIANTVVPLKEAGYTVEINEHLQTIAVDWPNGHGWFAQGEDAQEIFDDIPDDVDERDYILYYLESVGVFQ